MTPPTDIVIPFHSVKEHRTETYMQRCIDTLCQTTHNFRLILVDDASDEIGKAYLESVASRFPECALVRTYRQRWFTRAVNLGLRLVRTEWAVELNSDVILESGWLDELYNVKNEVEQTGNKVGLAGSVISPHDPRRYVLTSPPDYVTGHTWLLNMAALKMVAADRGTQDYLDETKERAIHIFSDNFICYDLNRLGFATIKCHRSFVQHEAGKSWGLKLHNIPKRVEEVDFRYA